MMERKRENSKRESRYSGTSLLRSFTGLGKSDLNSEVTVLPKLTSHSFCHGQLFGTEQWWPYYRKSRLNAEKQTRN